MCLGRDVSQAHGQEPSPDASPLGDKIGKTKTARAITGLVKWGRVICRVGASSTHIPEKLKLLKASTAEGRNS